MILSIGCSLEAADSASNRMKRRREIEAALQSCPVNVRTSTLACSLKGCGPEEEQKSLKREKDIQNHEIVAQQMFPSDLASPAVPISYTVLGYLISSYFFHFPRRHCRGRALTPEIFWSISVSSFFLILFPFIFGDQLHSRGSCAAGPVYGMRLWHRFPAIVSLSP